MWLHDLNRQRILERVGWTFWRCCGSSFVRDPDACIAELIALLNTLGIEPIGALDIDLSDIVEYREVGQTISDKDSAPPDVQADLELVPIPAVPEPAKVESRETKSVGPAAVLRVRLRDSVHYCFVDSPDDEAIVNIVDSESNPELGFINKDTAVARALLGAAVGQEREVALPMGKRRLRVLEILAPTQR